MQKFKNKKKAALAGGGQLRTDLQHDRGKKTARERLALLLDPDSFEETGQLMQSPHLEEPLPTDGVVTGFGTIDGKRVAIYAQDFTIRGGSLGAMHAKKICKVMDSAAKIGCPIIGLIDSGGARIEEGIHALAGYGDIFLRNTRYSGVIPQITAILGPCAGGAVYSPALTDLIFATEGIGQLFITGPQVIKEVLHQDISKDDLGGAHIHASKSGVVHVVTQTEEECFSRMRNVLTYLPSNYRDIPEKCEMVEFDSHQTLSEVVPNDTNKAYDVKKVINLITDIDSFFELQSAFAPNIVLGFARIDGTSIGIVANQPMTKAGTLDIDASCKAARFVTLCDNFSIPIISLVDVPGFLPGVDQEHNGIIRHGAKLLYAYANATTPKITVILRKAYGGSYIVMGSKHLGADLVYAWPEAEIAVMGATGAVQIMHRKHLATIESKQQRLKRAQFLEDEYKHEHLNPFTAAHNGYIDAVIEKNRTRTHLIRALEIMKEKVEVLPRRKKGNIPL